MSDILLFVAVYFVAVATPGPGIALVIARALSQGAHRLGWFIAGFVLGDIILMTLALSGLAIVAQSYAIAFQALKYVGVGYLLWMAWQMWRAPARVEEIDADTKRESPLRAFLSSLSLTLGNPKAIFFFLSAMPLVVTVGTVDLGKYVGLVAAIVLVMPPILGTFAFFAHRARKVFRSESALRRINKGSSILMAGAAAAIAKN